MTASALGSLFIIIVIIITIIIIIIIIITIAFDRILRLFACHYTLLCYFKPHPTSLSSFAKERQGSVHTDNTTTKANKAPKCHAFLLVAVCWIVVVVSFDHVERQKK